MVAQMGWQDKESFENAVEKLEKAIGKTVLALPTSDQHRKELFHLDTFMSVLPNGEVLLFKDALTEEGLQNIKTAVGEENIIYVSEKDAYNYATNLVVVGETIVSSNLSDTLAATLEDRGYKTVDAKSQGLSENDFLMDDGGVHCLTSSPDNGFADLDIPDDIRRSFDKNVDLASPQASNNALPAKTANNVTSPSPVG